MSQTMMYRHAHLCTYVITVSQVCSGTQQRCCSGIYELDILWVNIGNVIGFPNKCVNMNKLGTN